MAARDALMSLASAASLSCNSDSTFISNSSKSGRSWSSVGGRWPAWNWRKRPTRSSTWFFSASFVMRPIAPLSFRRCSSDFRFSGLDVVVGAAGGACIAVAPRDACVDAGTAAFAAAASCDMSWEGVVARAAGDGTVAVDLTGGGAVFGTVALSGRDPSAFGGVAGTPATSERIAACCEVDSGGEEGVQPAAANRAGTIQGDLILLRYSAARRTG